MKNGILKKFLAFVLCTAMIVTFMPSSVFTLADDGSVDNAVVQEESTPEKTSSEDKVMKTAEAPDTEQAETPAPTEVDEPKPEGDAESPEVVDESSGEEQAAPEAEPAEEQPAEGEEAKEEAKEDEGLNKEKLTFRDSKNSVDVYVVAQPGTFPEGTTMTVTPVANADVQDAVDSAMGGEVKNFKAVDITFYADGKKVEPKKEVSVRLTTKAFKSDEDLAVVHVEDPDKNKAQVMDLTKATDTVAQFRTDGFSVYVVIETEVPRMTLNFYSYDGTKLLETMYVKKADTSAEVDKIIHDPSPKVELNKDAGEVFYGWTTTKNYTPDAASSALSIEDVRTEIKRDKESLTTEDVTRNYYAVACRTYNVDYLGDQDVILGSHEIKMLLTDPENQSYTVNMTYTPADSTHDFEGWKVKEGGTKIIGFNPDEHEGEGTYYENGTEITISGSVTFAVNAPEGQWLVYDENAPSGSKATYNAPRFLKTGEVTVDPNTEDRPMTCVGYTFGEWFDSKEHADNLDSQEGKITFGGTITDRTTVYARWIPKEKADYTIVIWKQSVNGVDDSGDKVYDYVEAISVKNKDVGSTINAVTGTSGQQNASVNGTNYGWNGFHYQSNDQQGQTVKADNSTVINVYFDRNEYTLSFQIYDYTYTPTTSNDGTQYGVVDGEYVQLTRHNEGSYWNPRYYWTYGDTYWSEGTRYNGTRYTRSRNRSWQTIKEITALYEQNIRDNFPIVGTNGVTYEGASWQSQGSRIFDNDNMISFINDMQAESTTFRLAHNPEGYYYTYHVKYYVEALPGETDTVSFDGKEFTEFKDVEIHYQGSLSSTESEEFTDLTGFSQFGSDPEYDAQGHADFDENLTIKLYYTRKVYNLNYFDGVYVTNAGVPVTGQTARTEALKTVNSIPYNADMASYNKGDGGTNYYEPDPVEGFVFGGWYLDSACTMPCTFTNMPEGGMRVYAKWVQKEYRVLLHPNAVLDSGEKDTTLNWGGSVAMSFKDAEGAKVSLPRGLRQEYELVGWFTDPNFRHPVDDKIALTEDTTVDYDQTEDTELDDWGISTRPDYNKDAAENRYWVTGKLELYAQWRKVLEGAEGIGLSYTGNGLDNEGTAVSGRAGTDTKQYKDHASATAIPGATPSDTEKYRFEYWVVQKWNPAANGGQGAYEDTNVHVYAGAAFDVLKDDAKVVVSKWVNPENPNDESDTKDATHTKIKTATYTVQLRAQYIKIDEQTPTHIDWYSNYGSENEGKGEQYASYKEITINKGYDIYGKTGDGYNTPDRTGYKFKGWTKTQGGTTADFLVWTGSKYTAKVNGSTVDATQVAADEKQPYDDLFAVWEPIEYTVKFDKNASDATGTMADEEFKYDEEKPLTENAFTRPNYNFLGWSTDPNATSAAYTDKQSVKNLTSNDGDEVTLYAVWEIKKATVTVHHYLKGTTTQVKDDETVTQNVGTEYTATPVTSYQEKDLTVDSYNPSQKITVREGSNVITIYYTLPLEITAKSDSKPYDGTALTKNEYEITSGGLLEGDEISSVTVTGSQTLVGSSDNVPSNAEVVTKSGEGEEATETPAPYYVITYENGTLTVTDQNVTPSLVVTKSHEAKAEGEDKYAEGETVTFDISVKNIYNTAKTITLTEIPGVTLAESSFNNVAPGETKTTTATYTITAADMAAGSFVNTVTAAFSDSDKTWNATDTVNTEDISAALTVEKTADHTEGVKVNDKVTYTVVVTNSGNATVSGITLTDAKMAEADTPDAFSLAPSKSKTVTYTYTATQADVDAGKIENTATAIGKDPKNVDVTGEDSAEVTTVTAAPALTVTKTANPDRDVVVDSTITYTVVVKNTGNVTLKGVTLADSLVDLPAADKVIGDLAPAGEKTITYSYTVTQDDVDSGQIDNTATAKGKDPKNNEISAQDDATVTTVASDAKLTVEKTAAPTSNVRVGNKVTYTVVVTNNGNVTVKGITLDDSLVELTEDKASIGTLAPNGTKTITYEYTVTQDDVDAGKITNTASATGKDPKDADVRASDNAEVTTVAADAKLTVEKTAAPSSGVKAGDTVKYTVVVTNSGNVTVSSITLSDAKMPATSAPEAFSLAPAGTKTITYDYTVKQSDVDAGKIENTATATGKDPKNAEVKASDNAEVTTVTAAPALTVEKSASPASGVEVGDTVTYTVSVENTGNVTVTGITLADSKLPEDSAPTAFDLAPGDKREGITYTYTVTQADVDSGHIDNTATATGKDPKNKKVEASDDATVTTVTAAPALTVEKTADPTSGVEVDSKVNYTIVVTNSGNVTVSGITLEDDMMPASSAPQAFSLAPGKNKEITYEYTVKQSDVDAGQIDNTATATGKDPKNNDVEASDDATVTTVASDPELTVTKTASKTTGAAVDDVITYTVTVKNTGNVTVKGITLADAKLPADSAPAAFDLSPGAKKDDITYTYKVTQADVDAGQIENTATATGKDPKGTDVTGTASKTVTTVNADPKMTVTKTADPTSGLKVGQTVTYTITATNSGNVTINGLTVADALEGVEIGTLDVTSIAPGETATATATYVVTQGDVDAGEINNTATVTGKNPKGADVIGTASAKVTTEEGAPVLTVTKTASKTTGAAVDDEITYTVTVKNTGNVTVKGITLEDAKLPAGSAPAAFDLAPGQEKNDISYTYTVTQADVDAGQILNTVTAKGKNPKKEDVTGTASATVTTVEAAPAIRVTKSADPESGVGKDDVITYTVTVENTGNVTVKGITLADAKIPAGRAPAAFDLAPGAKKDDITYTYKVTQADVDAGQIENTVTATGKSPKNEDITGTASKTVTTEEPAAALTVDKDVEDALVLALVGYNVGDVITYKVKVTNSGNVSVTNGTLSDDHADLSAKTFALAPGETSEEFTYTYTVTQDDFDAGTITNTVKANATAARGQNPREASDSITIGSDDHDPELTVTKTASKSSNAAVDDVITYTVTVENTGNVTVKGITLEDAKLPAGSAPAAFDLAPGQKKENITYTYKVTQADVDAGQIDNTVTATGKDPEGEDVTGTASKTVTTVTADPKLTVTKSAEPAENVAKDGVITYTIVVTNSGNVTVKGIELEDTLVELDEEAFDLAPTDTKTITYTYTVNQTDVDAGKIDNTVTATGKDPKNADVTGTASKTVPTVASDAKLSVKKSANPTSGIKEGDTVTYTVEVTNDGNVTISDITLSDSKMSEGDAPETFYLAPGATKTVTYNYTAKQAEVDAGKITNTATATGKDPKGRKIETSATAEVTTVAPKAELTVEKSADPKTEVKVGDNVIYTVVVTNSGNVTVKGINLSDTLVTINEAAFDLAPGKNKTVTYEYTVKQADVDAGKVDNTATATGKDPKNADVTGTGSETVTTVAADPKLTVTKTADKSGDVRVGDTITYTVSVENTGNVTVKGITLDDAKLPAADTPAAFDLEPGQKKNITYTYKVTQADVDAGKVDNTATATGKNPKGGNVTDNASVSVATEEAQPGISVTKTADRTTGVTVGSRVNYTITVENTGNVTLNNVRVADTLVNFRGNSGTIASLAPGATATIRYAYTATAANVAAGRIVNTATVTGTAPDDTSVTDSASVTATTRAIPGGGGDNPDNPGGGGGNPGGGGGNPAGGQVAPTVVPDEPVPTVEPEVDIVDPEPPLAEGVWALINLIAAILTTLGAIVALFRRKEEEDEEDEEQTAYNAETAEEGEEDKDNRSFKMLTAKIVGALAGIAAPIVFMVTEDMSLPMALVDKWTVLMVVLLAVQVVAAALNKRASKLDDDEEEGEEQPAN